MKYFTVCVAGSGSRKYLNCTGLLFHDTEGQVKPEEIEPYLNHQMILDFFGGKVFMIEEKENYDGIVITNGVHFFSLPDRATRAQPPLVLYSLGTRYTVSLPQRFRECTHMIKEALGCDHCSDRGEPCISRSLPIDPAKPSVTKEPPFVNRKTKIGDFTFISPMLTVGAGTEFSTRLRRPEDHDFDNIAERSARYTKSNATRRERQAFKLDQCSTCAVAPACEEYAYCKGPWPHEIDVIESAMEVWEPRLKELPDGWEPWHLWWLARHGGRKGSKRFHRRHVQLDGVVWENGWRVAWSHTRRPTGRASTSSDLQWARELFDMPLLKPEDASGSVCGPVTDRTKLALFLMSLQASWGPDRSGGAFHGRIRDRITYREIRYDDKLWIGFDDRNYRYTPLPVLSVADFWRNVGRSLPNVFKKHVRD